MTPAEPRPSDRLPEIPAEAVAELRQIHAALEQAIAARGPACALSGRCCRFLEYGHTLFLSELEARVLVALAPAPARTLDTGATCPWQDQHNRCLAREARPIGCRAYFCDPAYEPDAHLVSEPAITALKSLTERHGIPWNYQPLHRHLHAFRDAGTLDIELAEPGQP